MEDCPTSAESRVGVALWNWRAAGREYSGLARSSGMMDKEPTTQHWRNKAAALMQRVDGAKSRFSASMSMNAVTMLAAADELQVATWDASLWMTINPCPDFERRERFALTLNTCAEVALTAQRAIADHSANVGAIMDSLGNLLTVVDLQAETLHAS
jgi:hypothetical protein